MDENARLRAEVSGLREQMSILRDWRDAIEQMPRPVIEVTPPIDALVVRVYEADRLVVLDKGKRDGVQPGFRFDLYLGTTYKGHIVIRDVQDSTSTGAILNEKNEIVVGDSATTRL